MIELKIKKTEIRKLFSEDQIRNLREFGKFLCREDPDIVILMARKAVCLYELFDYLEIPKPDCEFTSNRILDLDLNYLRGRKVLLVDDTLIVGSTLNEIELKLKSNGIQYSIAVFCIDKEQIRRDLIQPDYCQVEWSSEEVLSFAKTEVQSFSLIGRPYLVDFPISNFILINESSLKKLFNFDGLNVFETPNIDISSTAYNYTIFLNEKQQNIFLDSYFKNISSIFDIFKVKVYLIYNNSNEILLRIVPLVLLKPLSFDVIDELFLEFIDQSPDNPIYHKFIKNHKIKLRFIQHYISIIFGEFFISTISKTLPIFKNLYFKSTETKNLLGLKIGTKFKYLYPNFVKNSIPYMGSVNEIKTSLENKKILKSINIDEFGILDAFESIFENLYIKREIPYRKRKEFDDRLKKGIPFNEIINIFRSKLKFGDNIQERNLLSIGLDYCNDIGISIPVLVNENKSLFRSYRHGELALLNRFNKYLYALFLREFSFRSKKNELGRIKLQKLTVIFFRIASKMGFVDVTYDKNLKNIINVSYYTRGALLSSKKDYILKSENDLFLSKMIADSIIETSGNRYKIGRDLKYSEYIPKNKKNYISNIKSLASLIGFLSNYSNEGEFFSDRILVTLSSTFNPPSLAMALGAELEIISRWINLIKVNKTNSIKLKQLLDFNRDKSKFINLPADALISFNEAFKKLKSSLIKNDIDKINSNVKLKLDKNLLKKWQKFFEKPLNLNSNTFSSNTYLSGIISEVSNNLFYLGNWIHFIRVIVDLDISINNPSIQVYSHFQILNVKSDRVININTIKPVKKIKNPKYEVNKNSITGKTLLNKKVNSRPFNLIYNKETIKVRVLQINNTNIPNDNIEKFRNFNEKHLKGFIKSVIALGFDIKEPENFSIIKSRIEKLRSSDSFRFDTNLNWGLTEIIKVTNESKDLLETIISEYEDDIFPTGRFEERVGWNFDKI